MRRLSKVIAQTAFRVWLASLFVVGTVVLAQEQQKCSDVGPEPFSEAVVQQLMGTVRNGLIAHDADKMLSAFGGMRDYNEFAEQVRTFFSLYENFRVYYRILEVAAVPCADGDGEGVPRGRAVIEIQLQGDDAHNEVPGVARNGQLHVSFGRMRTGWRINDINREFFR